MPICCTISGSISGSAGLTKAGDGFLVLSGPGNNYTGSTTVSGGLLRQATNANSLPIATSLVISAGGAVDINALPQQLIQRVEVVKNSHITLKVATVSQTVEVSVSSALARTGALPGLAVQNIRDLPLTGRLVDRGPQPVNTESYAYIEENPFLRVADKPRSTFAVDVDTASYANVRRFLNDERLPPHDAVRIEELVNYFKYDYAPPSGPHPVAIHTEVAAPFWAPTQIGRAHV